VRPEIKSKTLLVELFRMRQPTLKLIDGALSSLCVVLLLELDGLLVELASHRNVLCKQLPPEAVGFVQGFLVVLFGVFNRLTVQLGGFLKLGVMGGGACVSVCVCVCVCVCVRIASERNKSFKVSEATLWCVWIKENALTESHASAGSHRPW
jgi:hypothetical protein